MSLYSWKVVIQLDMFMYLGEFFEAIQEEHEIDPIDYDETMNDMDPHLRQRSMKAELEFVYSNQV